MALGRPVLPDKHVRTNDTVVDDVAAVASDGDDAVVPVHHEQQQEEEEVLAHKDGDAGSDRVVALDGDKIADVVVEAPDDDADDSDTTTMTRGARVPLLQWAVKDAWAGYNQHYYYLDCCDFPYWPTNSVVVDLLHPPQLVPGAVCGCCCC